MNAITATGMLWQDDGKQAVAEKVKAAVDYYAAKYGQPAAVVHVHPRTLGAGGPFNLGIVQVVSDSKVLPNHYWVLPAYTPAP